MKKLKRVFIAALILTTLGFAGCNRNVIDLTFTFNYAYVELPNGEVIEGNVKSWRDYENSDQLQIEFENGAVYLVHSSKCTLLNNKEVK